MRRKRPWGFTLIELLVVIGVIAILATRWVRYGQGSTPAEKAASVERAFCYATAVAPMPPMPARPPGITGWGW